MQLSYLISKRIQYLQQLIEQKEKSVKHAPDGILRGNRHGKGWQYYWRKDEKDINGTYIRKKQLSFAKALGQKYYDEKLLKVAKQELKLLLSVDKHYKTGTIESLFLLIPLSHQDIVVPIQIPDEQYVQDWLATKYEKKEFRSDAPEYYTDNGERVRSKSEMLIANSLFRAEIPYLYEKPLYLKGIGRVHPDFTILDVENRREIYWEHMGMMDDREYRDGALAKMNAYQLSGYYLGEQFIVTFETMRQQLNMKVVEQILKNIKKEAAV